MRICFDMDGTIADLYGVNGWLSDIRSYNSRPYEVAKTLVNMNSLAKILNNLQRKGYEIGIISWLSKNSNPEYDEKVTIAKKRWLFKHLHSVHFNFIEIVDYGTDKNIVRTSETDILFDDEQKNRDEWNGIAYGTENIIEILKRL